MPDDAYILRLTLEGVYPAVWRRVRVPASSTLATLHLVLRAVMGWSAPRQYTFCFGTARFGSRHHDDLWLDDIAQTDVRDVRLSALLRQVGARMSWLYGDDPAWVHELVLEAVEDAAPLACMAGAGACPPVGCGGPAGYAEVLRQWSERRLDPLVASWLPRGFDPDHFDPAEVQLDPFIALQGRAALDAGLGGVLPWWGGGASQEVTPVRAAPRASERQVVEQDHAQEVMTREPASRSSAPSAVMGAPAPIGTPWWPRRPYDVLAQHTHDLLRHVHAGDADAFVDLLMQTLLRDELDMVGRRTLARELRKAGVIVAPEPQPASTPAPSPAPAHHAPVVEVRAEVSTDGDEVVSAAEALVSEPPQAVSELRDEAPQAPSLADVAPVAVVSALTEDALMEALLPTHDVASVDEAAESEPPQTVSALEVAPPQASAEVVASAAEAAESEPPQAVSELVDEAPQAPSLADDAVEAPEVEEAPIVEEVEPASTPDEVVITASQAELEEVTPEVVAASEPAVEPEPEVESEAEGEGSFTREAAEASPAQVARAALARGALAPHAIGVTDWGDGEGARASGAMALPELEGASSSFESMALPSTRELGAVGMAPPAPPSWSEEMMEALALPTMARGVGRFEAPEALDLGADATMLVTPVPSWLRSEAASFEAMAELTSGGLGALPAWRSEGFEAAPLPALGQTVGLAQVPQPEPSPAPKRRRRSRKKP